MRKKTETVRKICLVLFLCSSFLCLSSCGNESYFQTKEESALLTEEDNDGEKSSSKDQAVKDESAEITTECYVDVSGAVNCPGVYLLRSGSRVFEAIEMAGGLRADADTRDLNQAAVIADGQKLYIYTVGEIAPQTLGQAEEMSAADGKVNINSASREELMTLPGIGESKADAIIAYRQEKGPFSSAEEIKNISGIKEGVYSKIADSIKVN